MSRQRQQRKHKATDEEGGVRSKTNKHDSPRTDIERHTRAADAARLPSRLVQAGNTAVSTFLNAVEGGKPLESEVRNKMDRAYGEDFGDVRLHDDAQSLAAAGGISAQAFASGDDIYLGRSAPPVESEAGNALIAHELAHVTQQRHAKRLETGRVSNPNDRFEQVADVAAHKAVEGQRADSRTSGAPPALQRQPEESGATRAEVEQAITAFLEGAKRAQGGRTLQITTEVRQALEMLATAEADPGGMRLTNMRALLDNSMTPRDPAQLAAKVAQLLPEPFNRTALVRLGRAKGSKQAPASKMGRVGDLVKRTAPGSAESEQERVSQDKSRPRNQREEIAPSQAPGVPSAEKRAEYVRGLERTVRGEKEPGGIGPVTIDALRAIRILKDLPGALKGARQKSPQPRAQIFPEVARAIEQLVSPDALIPAETSGGEKRAQAAAGTFEDAREVAGRLAALLDIAHQQGSSEVDLPLVDAYNSVKGRLTIYSELRRIAVLVRTRLPHHAAGVTRVNVYFGRKMVQRIPLDADQ
ncbi:MAG: DUF4157 domain-containing protein [Blastocatellia bacterium]